MISGCHYLCDHFSRSQYSSHYIIYVVVKDDIKLHCYAKTNQGLARRTIRRYSTLRMRRSQHCLAEALHYRLLILIIFTFDTATYVTTRRVYRKMR